MLKRTIARGMHPNRQPLDDDSTARLLQGAVHPDDAPPGYGPVADLLTSAARLPLTPVDEDEAAATVAAMVEVIRRAAPAPALRAPQHRPMLARLLAGKALAAVAVVGLTATGAAAATDSLPDPVQRVVSDAAGHVGVNIPHPNRGKSAAHRQDGEHRQDGTHGQGGDAGQPTGTDGPTNGMSGVVEELKTDRGPEAGPLGPDVCVVASDGKCHSGDGNPGQGGDVGEGTTPPDSGPPAENPGQGHGPPAHPGGDAGTSPTGDESEDEDTPPTPPSTGGFETGKANSGGRAAGPAGKSQPAGD